MIGMRDLLCIDSSINRDTTDLSVNQKSGKRGEERSRNHNNNNNRERERERERDRERETYTNKYIQIFNSLQKLRIVKHLILGIINDDASVQSIFHHCVEFFLQIIRPPYIDPQSFRHNFTQQLL